MRHCRLSENCRKEAVMAVRPFSGLPSPRRLGEKLGRLLAKTLKTIVDNVSPCRKFAFPARQLREMIKRLPDEK
ncbi:hypothetical protein [uncultured Desulfovibrio sp.]|uniref:hypothetical protein n=1 Tax=uncultured Desulfovibrio sp. TaxID=167968 RepID=UPI002639A42D|nr:hypothetical protein [uncultured Desulfovibrio sp.]